MHRLDRLDALAESRNCRRERRASRSASDPSAATTPRRSLDLGARRGVARHEELADGVMAGRRAGEAELGAFLGEEAVRNLGQYAAAVAERRVGADGAAMVEVDENLQALFEDRVRLAVLHVGDEADAAGIMLVGGVIETLRREAAAGRRRGPGAVLRKRRAVAGRWVWRSSLRSPAARRRLVRLSFAILDWRISDKGGRDTRAAARRHAANFFRSVFIVVSDIAVSPLAAPSVPPAR